MSGTTMMAMIALIGCVGMTGSEAQENIFAHQATADKPATAQTVADKQMRFEIPSPDTIQILTTLDGSVNIGRIVEIGETDVRFETNHGSLVIQKDQIKSIKKAPISTLKKGQYWAPNSNATRQGICI